ncbi:MAG TPA: hypothetical protein VKK79_15840 [Candidatus Lokiarchaeia archaeon]|nr:hypothetical protein [Candidatus Lokiarchaeia archaeon]
MAVILIGMFAYAGTWLPELDATESVAGLTIFLFILLAEAILVHRSQKKTQTPNVPSATTTLRKYSFKTIEFWLSVGTFLVIAALSFLFFPRSSYFYSIAWSLPWVPANFFTATPFLFFAMLTCAEWAFLARGNETSVLLDNCAGIYWLVGAFVAFWGVDYWIEPTYIGSIFVTLGVCVLLLGAHGSHSGGHVESIDAEPTSLPPPPPKSAINPLPVIAFFAATLAAFWGGFLATTIVAFDQLNQSLVIFFLSTGVFFLIWSRAWSLIKTRFKRPAIILTLSLLIMVCLVVAAIIFKDVLISGNQDAIFQYLLLISLGSALGFVCASMYSARLRSPKKMLSFGAVTRQWVVWVSLVAVLGGYLGSRTLELPNPLGFVVVFSAIGVLITGLVALFNGISYKTARRGIDAGQ